MAVEVSFMVGPLAGVWLATALPTSWALLVLGAANVVAGGLLFLANPPLRTEAADADAVGRRRWIGRTFIALCAVAAATTLVLSGTDIAVVAVMRSAGAGGSIGVVLAIWGVGSFLGGLAYGALHRELPATWLLAGLAVLTAPVALASSAWSVGALLLLAGVCCAPAITAGVHQVSAVVPESARGEALGWHGSAMTVGSAVGGPLAGAAVDSGGAPLGFLVIAGAGLAVAGVGAAMLRRPVRPAGGGPGVRPGALASER
jgi:predicted MFS family arabinose efflux permease